ncbi:transglycosylase SLT domain-containing protein [Bosea sp. (in: a-proteobacteria)]|uniref:transglycosylase SLT domain-containing protein n=1 Tax=Bosea sp. (in: a-proteobacteria) TaxID=1871050 RepID=UPI00273470E2|nr:transglycosylase SLT domain-containing protein [Bosea sp. (in: a-proteobacteria)]MDP3410984.1 transglycosylase SLT domain-containing protein [Bosea sp. (in: a-proteobacteria)]
MSERFRQFQAVFPEEACLDALMRARHGGSSLTCPACSRPGRFEPRVKLRACSCEHCNYMLQPGAGTVLDNRRTPLQLWFFALKTIAELGDKAAAGVIEREARVPALTARRLVAELTALDARGEDWFEALRRGVSGERPVAITKAVSGTLDSTDSIPKPLASPGPEIAARGVSGRAMMIGVAVGIVCLTAAVLGIALNKMGQGEAPPDPDMVASLAAPALQTAARPSLILSSVESDLEAARQATEFALKADPTLAEIKAQVEAAPEIPVVPLTQPPSNILLVPPKLPAGQAAPGLRSRIPQAPITTGGDPEQLLTFGPIRIRRHLVETIVRAGKVVGADPTLLMAVADKESSFSTSVQAKTSSATGLYQFIEQTWLGVVSEFGTKHGLAAEAKLIGRNGRQFVVADAAERQRILDLRREPYLSALLAGEMLKRDTLRLEKAMGRHLTGGEIYLIHFLGPDAAQTFIETMEEKPDVKAADLLPRPAQANRPIFYADAGGETKTLSVSEVHRKFNEMIKVRLDRYKTVRPAAPQQAERAKK